MFVIRSLLHGELLLQISVQVLIEPVAHVLQSFLRTRDSGCIIVAVSHSPSMRHARENFDKVIDLQSKKKNRRTDDSVKYFNLNCECSHDPKGQTFFF